VMLKTYQLSELFTLRPGSFHATWELDPGDVPLVSCGWENNGVIGYYDIQPGDLHERALTVAFNGAPLTTHFHPYRFGAKDDVAVLEPVDPLPDSLLIYVAAVLNSKVWRYSYGRKCYREKLARVDLALPVTANALDPTLANELLENAFAQVKADAATSIGALLNGRRSAS
jgi:type I restriction enzyme M protein